MASLTVPASATTRTSPAASSIVLRPLRTTSWSSTSIRRNGGRRDRSSFVVSRISCSTTSVIFPRAVAAAGNPCSPVWLSHNLRSQGGQQSRQETGGGRKYRVAVRGDRRFKNATEGWAAHKGRRGGGDPRSHDTCADSSGSWRRPCQSTSQPAHHWTISRSHPLTQAP